MYLATYFRGRMTFKDLLELDVCYIPTFNKIAYEERKSKDAQDRKSGELMEDAMQGDI